MKLNLEQLNAAVDGVPEVVEESGLFRLRRFTDEQRFYTYEPESPFLPRTYITPGGKLDFTTDAGSLAVTLTECFAKTSFKSYGMDVWQDGVLTHHVEKSLEGLPVGAWGYVLPEFSHTFSLKEGVKRVELFFPRNVNYKIQEIALPDGASFEPTVHAGRLLVLGDSITAACNTRFPSLAYMPLLSRALDLRTFNYAVGGEVYREKTIVPGTYPDADAILVAYGTNGRKNPERWKTNTPAFFEAFHREFGDKPAYVILPIHSRKALTQDQAEFLPLEEARRIIREICAKYDNLTVLDGEKYVPWDDACFDDGLHPNDLGMAHYAMNVIADLKKYF